MDLKNNRRKGTFNFFTGEAEITGKGIASSALKSHFLRNNIQEEDFDKTSLFGTPVYSNLEIPAGRYRDLDGKNIEFQGIRIDTVMFDVSQEKNIVKTAISGKNGTIKQYIADGDFVINCQGIINSITEENGSTFDVRFIQDGGVPEEEIRKFKAICSVPKEIEVVSEFLDFFDISTVVIESYNFSQVEGERTQVLFSLSMISDQPIELK